MGVLVALTTGLSIWLVLWAAFEIKSFDAFLLTILIAVVAATVHISLEHLPGKGRSKG